MSDIALKAQPSSRGGGRSPRGLAALFDVYRTQVKMTVAESSAYRASMIFQLTRWFVEPVIYLVVWSTIAVQSGGEVQGYTPGQFAGYFIAWTLVRQMTIGWDPNWMEWRIRRGDFTSLLLKPIHPFHVDTANMLGHKVVELTAVIPTMLLLALLFKPEIDLQGWSVAAFVPVLIMGFLLRYIWLYLLALSAFWTTRVTALFRLLFWVEFFISGRIAPLALLPEWAQNIAEKLPYYWMFGFPLELLVGRITPDQALAGFVTQAIWVTAVTAGMLILWRFAVRRYSAVGG